VEEILPSVEVMAADYQKISPLVNFMADYWSVAIIGLALVVAGGAAAGAFLTLKRLDK